MKSIAVILFLLLYGLALIRPAFPLLDYFIQLEEYQAKCVNKARPELACNGQCILMQKLKAAGIGIEEPLTPPAPAKINLEDYPIGIIPPPNDAVSFFIFAHDWITDHLHVNTSAAHTSDIFHPPAV